LDPNRADIVFIYSVVAKKDEFEFIKGVYQRHLHTPLKKSMFHHPQLVIFSACLSWID